MRGKIIISRIRGNCSYTIPDLCRKFGFHKNTVRDWLRKGLPKTDNQRPCMIHGNELKTFLSGRQKARRKKCAPNEFYCFRCKVPRHAMGNMADIEIRNRKTVMLNGFCVSCEMSIHKLQAAKDLTKIFETFDIPKLQQEHIRESLKPSLNCDLEKEP